MSVSVQVNLKLLRVPRSLLVAHFFDPHRYDLAAVGRYHKINKKLNIKDSFARQTIAEPLVDAETGEILVEAGTLPIRSVIDSIRAVGQWV